MKEAVIHLEEAGATLAEWVRRARREHTAFVVLDASTPVARLIPTELTSCTGAALASVLARTNLSRDEAQDWAKDLREARVALSPPQNKWQ